MTTAAEWSGRVGDAWAERWAATDRSFEGLSVVLDAVIRDAAPVSGRAIDLGCGAGVTSIALADARHDLTVTGVDVSADLVQIAAARAGDRRNVHFALADLNADVACADDAGLLVSRHGVMFFADPAAVFARLADAVRPGARLVFSCFRVRELNPWAGALAAAIGGATPPPVSGYAPGPFAFADPGFVALMLGRAGWRVDPPEPVDYAYVAGAGDDPVADAIAFFGRIGPVASALAAAASDARPAMVDALARELQSHRVRDTVAFPAAAWIWRATARGPA